MIEIKEFIDNYVFNVSEKYKNTCSRYFIATNSWKDEDYKLSSKAQLARENIYTNKDEFNQIKNFKESNIQDPLLKRQIELL